LKALGLNPESPTLRELSVILFLLGVSFQSLVYVILHSKVEFLFELLCLVHDVDPSFEHLLLSVESSILDSLLEEIKLLDVDRVDGFGVEL